MPRVTRPTTNDPASMEQWFDYVYLRDNPRGRFDEYAHHSGGCRAWLVVSRNTETHEVYRRRDGARLCEAQGSKA